MKLTRRRILARKRKQDPAVRAASRHHPDRGDDSMSPEIRRLAIGWGGPNEVASPRIEEREFETSPGVYALYREWRQPLTRRAR